ncbi:MAG: ATP-binding protein, partial [Myxococcales bacterium]|nr:ATP-binding protein [Myxococcales bacterium]
QRAFSLVGPYGSGKSAFLTFLTNLLAHGPAHKPAVERLNWMDFAQGQRTRKDLVDVAPLVPCLLTGRRVHLGTALLAALRETADAFWQGRGVNPPVVQALREADDAAGEAAPDDDQIVELALALAAQIERSSRSGRGLLLVIDEFGKFLEWAALHPAQADVYLLQRLAEAAARSPAPLILINVLHQDMASYARGLPRAMRDEWTKWRGASTPFPTSNRPNMSCTCWMGR